MVLKNGWYQVVKYFLVLKSCGLSIVESWKAFRYEFEIIGCDELRYLSGEFEGFMSLQLLRIDNCSKLASIPNVQHCTTLVELSIWNCPELISIPGDFRELRYSLKKLRVWVFKLRSLPRGLQIYNAAHL